MRKKIVAGNWKMNKTFPEAVELFKEIDNRAASPEKLDAILIFPPFPYIETLSRLCENVNISVGAQNLSSETDGAFTGEVSGLMLRSVGATHALVGHSERRSIFKEESATLKIKVDRCLEAGMIAVFCCGEQLRQRQANQHFEVIKNQLSEGLFHLNVAELASVIIAYEPVWAIGTGVTATADQAQEMHAFIRDLVRQNYDEAVADKISILYGGSCNSSNARELFGCEDIDGGLIGGASLKAEEFLRIISGLDD